MTAPMLGVRAMADWLLSWLPQNVGVFFQNDVSVHARGHNIRQVLQMPLRRSLPEMQESRCRSVPPFGLRFPLGDGRRVVEAENSCLRGIIFDQIENVPAMP